MQSLPRTLSSVPRVAVNYLPVIFKAVASKYLWPFHRSKSSDVIRVKPDRAPVVMPSSFVAIPPDSLFPMSKAPSAVCMRIFEKQMRAHVLRPPVCGAPAAPLPKADGCRLVGGPRTPLGLLAHHHEIIPSRFLASFHTHARVAPPVAIPSPAPHPPILDLLLLPNGGDGNGRDDDDPKVTKQKARIMPPSHQRIFYNGSGVVSLTKHRSWERVQLQVDRLVQISDTSKSVVFLERPEDMDKIVQGETIVLCKVLNGHFVFANGEHISIEDLNERKPEALLFEEFPSEALCQSLQKDFEGFSARPEKELFNWLATKNGKNVLLYFRVSSSTPSLDPSTVTIKAIEVSPEHSKSLTSDDILVAELAKVPEGQTHPDRAKDAAGQYSVFGIPVKIDVDLRRLSDRGIAEFMRNSITLRLLVFADGVAASSQKEHRRIDGFKGSGLRAIFFSSGKISVETVTQSLHAATDDPNSDVLNPPYTNLNEYFWNLKQLGYFPNMIELTLSSRCDRKQILENMSSDPRFTPADIAFVESAPVHSYEFTEAQKALAGKKGGE